MLWLMQPTKSQPGGAPRRGGVKFVLLHHRTCLGGAFHYRIDARGNRHAELDEALRGQHPRSIGVVVEADCDAAPPSDAQIGALKALLLALKLRYPAVEVGAHRQVRGDAETTCPGRHFPMKALAEWCRSELLRQRDGVLARDFESQYSNI